MAGHRHRSRRGPVRRTTAERARRMTAAQGRREVELPVQLAVNEEAEVAAAAADEVAGDVAAAAEPHAVDTNLRFLFAADRTHRFRPVH